MQYISKLNLSCDYVKSGFSHLFGVTKLRTRTWEGNLDEIDHAEALRIDGNIILKWILMYVIYDLYQQMRNILTVIFIS
jgi:hypothetical protein